MAEEEEEEQGDQSGLGDFTNPYGFNSNQTVILKHYFGKTLRVKPDDEGEANENGGHGQFARWIIELDGSMDGSHVVKLKSNKSDKYLRIFQGGNKLNVTGNGGKLCRFKVYKQDSRDNSYKFESVNFEKRYPAVQAKGVAIGNGGKYTEFTIWSDKEDGAYAPPKEEESKENMEQQDQSGMKPFDNPYLLNSKQNIILKHYFGKTLRIDPNSEKELDFKGGKGQFAKWAIKPDGEEDGCKVVMIQQTITGKYLRIWKGGNEANVDGNGGKLCRFKAHKQDSSDNSYKFESINFAGNYVAVQPKGCGIGNGGKYTEFTVWSDCVDVDEEEKKKEEEEAARLAAEEEEKKKKEEEEE
eukprot:136398_1